MQVLENGVDGLIRGNRAVVFFEISASQGFADPAVGLGEAEFDAAVAEVTVIEVWRELVKSQKTRPENKQA
jgi:hypothetical protein